MSDVEPTRDAMDPDEISSDTSGACTQSSAAESDIDTEIEEHFQWLRMEALNILLVTLTVVMWLAIVPFLLHADDFWPGWGAPLIALVVILGSHALKGRNYHLASNLLIFGLAILISARTFSGISNTDATPFLYIPVVLIAGTLERTRIAMLVTLLATVTLLAYGLFGNIPLGAGATTQVMLALWITALVAWLTKRSLNTTLHWYWHSQQEATKNLEETRRHRGELAAALKQLAEATYRLERMNYALNWARLDAEQARRAKAQFAAQVSHELRTPINLIVGFSDMMLNVPHAYDDAQLPLAYLTDLQTLHRSAKLLQGMIDDILDLSQLDAREMPLLRESVTVATIIHEAVATVGQLMERKGLTVDVEIHQEVTTAYLDPLRIRQVLLNLLSNASRHTTCGGVTIRAQRENDNVIITVIDTGEGINPHQIPFLFEAFHRLDPSGIHEGWGLGLAICKQFIELHGGTITAASEGIPGRGTTFSISLPIYPLANETPVDLPLTKRASGQLSVSASPPSLVVVDSDPHVVTLYRRYLNGYQVHGAASQEDAITMAQALGAHAILVNLPPDHAHTVWPGPWLPCKEQNQLRVVGCSLPSRQQVVKVTGLTDFLVKPVQREALLTAVRRANPDARTIVVIDDDLHMARMLDRMLRSSGEPWDIVRVHDVREGLALIQSIRPDIVLLDLLMPHGGGFSLLKSLREDRSMEQVAVIAVSAQDIAELLPAGNGRVLSLISDRALTIPQILRGVRSLLDLLPPPTADLAEPAPAPAEEPVGSTAFG